jgi:SAM-dependent methyltransferase
VNVLYVLVIVSRRGGSVGLERIKEIDELWGPVYPYLVRHIEELYGRREGTVLEIGPFVGVIFSLMKEGVGDRFVIASFPPGMTAFFMEQAKKAGAADKIAIVETDPSLSDVEEKSVDLAVFRGAFFFPSLFDADLGAIYRVLKPGGLAFVGGGFGKYTPDTIISNLGKRSRDLNLQLGKVEISEQMLRRRIVESCIPAHAEVIDEGGLWVVIKK